MFKLKGEAGKDALDAWITWKDLRRRYCGGQWWPASDERTLLNPATVGTTRYRYRGTVIPSPWPATG